MVKPANADTDPERQIDGNPAACQRLAHRAPEVERRAPPVPALLRQPRRHLPGQRPDRLPQLGQLRPGGVEELHVLGQRAPQRRRDRLRVPVGDEPAPDLRLDLGAGRVHARILVLFGQPAPKVAQAVGARRGRPGKPGRVPQPPSQRLQVEPGQRAVQVERPGHHAPRFDACPPVDRLDRHRPQQHAVPSRHGPEQQVVQLVLAELVQQGTRAQASLADLAAAAAAVRLAQPGELPPAEEDVEGKLEGPVVIVVLHQRGGQRALHLGAIGQRDGPQRCRRVHVLGQ